MATGVKVCIRARPMIKRESGFDTQWSVDTHIVKPSAGRDKTKSYIFDRVFSEGELTSDVYEEIAEPIVESAMKGFNGTIFAYGQTSSGKTYTMLGSPSSKGVIPLAVQDVFDTIERTPEREFLLRVSYLEIYNENLKDLLSTTVVPLQIREDEFKSVIVSGLHEEMVTSANDVIKLMSKGEKNRQMAATNMNERSSRSHTIFRMIIESRQRDLNRTADGEELAVKVSQLNLVDLAGSERTSQTGAEGLRFKEGCSINKSLMVLGQVINQICKDSELGSGSVFKNFRDSKLTRILQSSLGGNSLTAIICTVTLAALEETESTLRFASSAKHIKNKPIVNEVLSDEALLNRQKREINQLKKKIEQMERQQGHLERQQGQQQQGDVDNLLAEKDLLQEKNEKLTRMLLTSSLPVDYAKKQQRLRRETWCPGADKKKMTSGWNVSPSRTMMESDFSINQSTFINDLDMDERSRLFETPSVPTSKRHVDSEKATTTKKKMRFTEPVDDGEDLNLQLKLVQAENSLKEAVESGNKERDELLEKVVSLEIEIEELKKTESEDLLKLQVGQLKSQVKMQEETINQFLTEQSEAEEENEALQKKFNRASQQIVELERRELARSNESQYVKGLQSQVEELQAQLTETCRDNRRMQERCDEEAEQSNRLSTSVEKLSSELEKVRQHSDLVVEEYKEKMSMLQSQLESSLSSTKSPDCSSKMESEISCLKEELSKKSDLVDELENEVLGLHRELLKAKEDNDQALLDLRRELTVPNKADDTLDSVFRLDSTKEQFAEEAIQQCEVLLKENAAMKLNCENLRAECSKKENDITELGQQVDRHRQELKSIGEMMEFDKNENKILFEEEKKLREENMQLKETAETLKETLRQLQNNSNTKDSETDSEKMQSLLDEIARLNETVDELQRKNEEQLNNAENSKSGTDQAEYGVIEKLRKELHNLEKSSSDAQALLQDANHKLAEANSNVTRLQEQKESLERDLLVMQADVESYMALLDLKGPQKKSCQMERSFAQEKCEDADDQDLEKVKQQIDDLQEKLNGKEDEMKDLVAQSEAVSLESQKEISELKQKLESVCQNLEIAKSAERELQMSDTEALVSELDEVKQQVAELQDKINAKEAEMENLVAKSEKALSESRNEVVELKEKLESANEDLKKLTLNNEEQVESGKQISDLEEQLHVRGIEVAALESKTAEILEELHEAREELSKQQHASVEKHNQVDSLPENHDASLGSSLHEVESLKMQLASFKHEIDTLTARNVQLQEKANQSQGALLAEQNKELGIDRQLHKADQLQKSSLEIIAHERIAADKEILALRTQLDEKQKALSKVTSANDITQHQLEKQTTKCQELQIEIAHLEKSQSGQSASFFSGGSNDTYRLEVKNKQLSQCLELNKQKIEKIEENHRQLLVEKRRIEDELYKFQSTKQELNAALAAKANLEEQVSVKDIQLSDTNSKLAESEMAVNEKCEKLRALSEELNSVLASKQCLEEDISVKNDELSCTKSKLAEIDSILHETTDHLQSLKQESDLNSAANANLKTEIALKTDELSSSNLKLAEVESTLFETINNLQSVNQELESTLAAKESLEECVSSKDNELSSTNIKLTEMESTLSETVENLKSVKQELDLISAAKADLEKDIAAKNDELACKTLKLTEMEKASSNTTDDSQTLRQQLDLISLAKAKLEEDIAAKTNELSSSNLTLTEVELTLYETSANLQSAKQELDSVLAAKANLEECVSAKDNKLSSTNLKLTETESTLSETAENLQSLKQELDLISAAKANLEEDITAKSDELECSNLKVASMEATVSETTLSLQTVKQELDLVLEAKASLEKDIAAKNEELVQLTEQKSTPSETLEVFPTVKQEFDLFSGKPDLEEETSTDEEINSKQVLAEMDPAFSATDERWQSLKLELDASLKENANLKEEISVKVDQLASLKVKLAATESSLTETQENLQPVKQESDSLLTVNANLEQEILLDNSKTQATSSETEALQSKLLLILTEKTNLEEVVLAKDDQLSGTNLKLAEMETTLSEITENLQTVKQELDSILAEKSTLKQQIRSKDSEISQLSAQLEDKDGILHENYEKIITVEQKLNSILEEKAQLQQQISTMNEQLAVLESNSAKSHETPPHCGDVTVVESLIQSPLAEETQPHLISSEKSTLEQEIAITERVQTLQGELKMQQQEADRITEELKREKYDKENVLRQLTDLRNSVAANKEEHARLLEGQEHLGETEQNFLKLYNEYAQITAKNEELQADNDQLNQRAHERKLEIDAKSGEILELQDLHQAQVEEKVILEQTLSNLRNENVKLQKRICDLQDQIDILTQSQVTDLQTQLEEIKSRHESECSELHEAYETQLKEKTRLCADLQETCEIECKKNLVLEAQIEKLKADLENESFVNVQDSNEISSDEKLCLESKITELQVELETRNETISEIQETANLLLNDKLDLELKCNELKTQCENWAEEISQIQDTATARLEENHNLSSQISELRSELEQSTASMLQLQDSSKALHEEKSTLESQLTNFETELSQKNKEISEFQESNNLLCSEKATIELEIATLQSSISERDSVITELKTSLDEQSAKLEAAASDVLARTADYDNLKYKTSEEKSRLGEMLNEEKLLTQQRNSDLEEKDKLLSELRGEIDFLQKNATTIDHKSCQDKMSDLQEEIDVSTLELRRRKDHIEMLTEQLTTKDEKLNEAILKTESLYAEILNAKAGKESENQIQTEQLVALQSQVEILNTEKESLSSTVQKYAGDLENARSANEKLLCQVSDLKKCVPGDRSHLIEAFKAQEQLTDAEKNFMVLYLDFQTASTNLSELQEETAELKSSLKEANFALTEKDKVISDQIKELNIVVNEKSTLEENFTRNVEGKIKDTRSRLKDTIVDLEAAKVTIANLQKEKTKLEVTIKTTEGQVEKSSQLIDELKESSRIQQEDKLHLDSEFAQMQVRCDELTKEISAKECRVQELEKKLTESLKNMFSKSEMEAFVDTKIQEQHAMIDRLEKEIAEKNQQIEVFDEQNASLKQRFKKDLEKASQSFKAEVRTQVETYIQEYKEKACVMNEDLKTSKAKCLELDEKLKQSETSLKDTSRQLGVKLDELYEINGEYVQMEDEIEQLKKTKENNQAEIEELRSKLEETAKTSLGVSKSSGSGVAALQKKLKESEKKIKELEKKFKDSEKELKESQKYSSESEDLKISKAKCLELEEKLKESEASLKDTSRQLGVKLDELYEINGEYVQMEDEIEQLKEFIEKNKDGSAVQTTLAEMRELKKKLEQAESKLRESERKLKNAETWLERSESAAQASEAKSEALEKQLKGSEKSGKSGELKTLTARCLELEQKLKESETSLKDTSRQLGVKLDELYEINGEYVQMEDEIEQLKEFIEKNKDGSAVQTTLAEMRELKKKLEQAESKLRESERKLKNAETWLERSESAAQANDTKHEGLEKKLKESEKNVELIAKLKKHISKLEQALRGSGNQEAIIPGEVENLRQQLQEVQEQHALELNLKKSLEMKVFRMKEQLRVQTQKHDESVTSSSRMSTRSSSRNASIIPGGVVQLTKLEMQEMAWKRDKARMAYLEKELAKYKDIEVKRRAENQRLLDQNRQMHSQLKDRRTVAHVSPAKKTEEENIPEKEKKFSALPPSPSPKEDDENAMECKTQ